MIQEDSQSPAENLAQMDWRGDSVCCASYQGQGMRGTGKLGGRGWGLTVTAVPGCQAVKLGFSVLGSVGSTQIDACAEARRVPGAQGPCSAERSGWCPREPRSPAFGGQGSSHREESLSRQTSAPHCVTGPKVPAQRNVLPSHGGNWKSLE